MTLQEATENNNVAEVDRILMETPNLVDGEIQGIWIPHFAAGCGVFDVVKYIVEYSRASFNTVDERNRGILHYAVESGNLPMVQYLTERVGMSPVKGDVDCITPYQLVYELAKGDVRHTVMEKDCEQVAVKQEAYQAVEQYFEKSVGAKYEEMYHNPILTGMHPDPSIVRVGEDYYMVNSSFVFFPCIPISHSKDLIHWEVIGHAITNPKWAKLDELEGGRGYWAPDISYYEGRFYIAATYRLNDTGTVYRKQMITSAERPEGPYCEPIFLDEDGIDPSIFTDDDGRRYVLLNRGARIFEISPDGKKQISKAELLFYGDYKRAPEGSHLLKKDGWYYLFEAEGGTGLGHRITVSRSRTLKGIYEPCPFNPIMRQEDELGAIQRCGHGKPVQTQNGEWYMVYLCGRQLEKQYSLLGRETAMDPITWTADGWPMVNRLQGPSCLQVRPNLPNHPFETDITPAGNAFEWVSSRPPVEGGIVVQDGKVTLKGSKAPLSSFLSRNIYVRRQTAFDFDFEATMELGEFAKGQHAGILGYYDENTYVRCSLEKQGNVLAITLTEHIGTQTTVAVSVECEREIAAAKHLSFRMETRGLERQFFYHMDDAEAWTKLGTLPNVYYLCDEGISMGKRFTGAMVGIYAYAGETEDLVVSFENFKYENKEN